MPAVGTSDSRKLPAASSAPTKASVPVSPRCKWIKAYRIDLMILADAAT